MEKTQALAALKLQSKAMLKPQNQQQERLSEEKQIWKDEICFTRRKVTCVVCLPSGVKAFSHKSDQLTQSGGISCPFPSETPAQRLGSKSALLDSTYAGKMRA